MRHRDGAKRACTGGQEAAAGEFDLHGDALDIAWRELPGRQSSRSSQTLY
jgi:hypothetical protein